MHPNRHAVLDLSTAPLRERGDSGGPRLASRFVASMGQVATGSAAATDSSAAGEDDPGAELDLLYAEAGAPEGACLWPLNCCV